MKQRTFMTILTLVLIGFFVAGVSASADDVKTRMKKRLPVLKELKAKGIVGEDKQGYLQFVGAKKEKADVIAAENKDRKTVYAAIAKQQGTTAELVGVGTRCQRQMDPKEMNLTNAESRAPDVRFFALRAASGTGKALTIFKHKPARQTVCRCNHDLFFLRSNRTGNVS
jgi:uncharacterized protein YdbL (DUF1318 family)